MDDPIMNQFMDYESSSKKIEQLNGNKTFVHGVNPFVKIIATILYLALILSYNQYDLDGLLLFTAFLILTTLVAEIPFTLLLKKIGVALPFILVLGISNLILNTNPVFIINSFIITRGMISCLTILLKTGMSITAVYILIATTENKRLIAGFRLMGVPNLFLVQFELIIRYIGVLVEEAKNMYYAYRLRMPGVKGIVIRHMGEFLGQLLIKSIYRAERIYHAMKCRGYNGDISSFQKERLKRKDYLQLFLISIIMIFSRFFEVF